MDTLKFPAYLLPSHFPPWRRRSSTASTSSSTSSDISSPPASPSNLHYPQYSSTKQSTFQPPTPIASTTHIQTLICTACRSSLCPSSSIISRGFQGRHGRAFLLSSLSPSAAITLSEAQQRQLVTGMHTVRDFACGVCGIGLGWRYEAAEEKEQKYKVGKWILEGERVGRGNDWLADNEDGTRGEEEDVITREIKEVLARDEVEEADWGRIIFAQ